MDEAQKQDKLKRAYAQLISIKKHSEDEHPNNTLVSDVVNQYEKQLDSLESIGVDVNEFRISREMISPQVVSSNYLTNETVATGRTNVRVGYFLTLLDALLNYFDLSTENGKTQIGFHN